MSKPETNEDLKKLAERIVSYETRDKGTIDDLFAFEARDGFWSKLAKTTGPILSAIGTAALTFMTLSGVVTGPVGVVVAGVAAAATGLTFGAINRALNKVIFSDLHDSHKGNLGKFGHYLGIGLGGTIAGAVINTVVPGAGTLAGDAVALVAGATIIPLAEIITSKGIAAGFGDQQLRRESAEAREIAQQAIESGQSVAQLLDQGKSANRVSTQAAEVEYSLEGKREFAKMIEQQRANSQKLSIT